MKKYFLIDNNCSTVESSSEKLEEIQKAFSERLEEDKKRRWESNIEDYGLYEFEYDENKIEIDYWMDRELYILDKINDKLIDCEDFEKFWIKEKELSF